MIKSAEGSARLLHKITKPTMWSGGVQILEKEEEDARLLDRCEAKYAMVRYRVVFGPKPIRTFLGVFGIN